MHVFVGGGGDGSCCCHSVFGVNKCIFVITTFTCTDYKISHSSIIFGCVVATFLDALNNIFFAAVIVF
jgi:hypothetical protein